MFCKQGITKSWTSLTAALYSSIVVMIHRTIIHSLILEMHSLTEIIVLFNAKLRTRTQRVTEKSCKKENACKSWNTRNFTLFKIWKITKASETRITNGSSKRHLNENATSFSFIIIFPTKHSLLGKSFVKLIGRLQIPSFLDHLKVWTWIHSKV